MVSLATGSRRVGSGSVGSAEDAASVYVVDYVVFSNIFFFFFKIWARAPFQRGSGAGQKLEWVSFGFAMSSVTWGSEGSSPCWSVPWTSLDLDSRVDFTACVVCPGPQCLVSCTPCGTRARVLGLGLEDPAVDAVSVFHARLVCLNPVVVLECDASSLVMSFPKMCPLDFSNLFEVCSGLGIAGFGFKRIGLTTVVANEIRESMAGAFMDLHPSIPMVIGDISCPSVVHQIWRHHGRSALLFGGFACQPFSRGGLQLGGLDPRSGSLVGTLRAAIMLRVPVIYLECVQEASNNSFVRGVLQSFCAQCRFHCSEVLMSFSDTWVSRRDRWWVVLTAQLLGQVFVPSPPCFPFPSQVRHVLPAYLELSEEELSQLALQESEYRKFVRHVPELSTLFLRPTGKAPTALHSWGSQVCACHCGCRQDGFSDELLRTRGLYAVLVPCPAKPVVLDGVEQPGVRHLHPTELALLTCVPVPPAWPADLRLTLAGLGQQATPLQALWVAGVGQVHLEKLLFGQIVTDVGRAMDDLRHEVLLQSRALFAKDATPLVCCPVLPVSPVAGCGSPIVDELATNEEPVSVPCPSQVQQCPGWRSCEHQGDDSTFTLVDSDMHSVQLIALSSLQLTVGNLVAAETQVARAADLVVFDCKTGHIVDDTDTLSGRAFCLIPVHDGYTAPAVDVGVSELVDASNLSDASDDVAMTEVIEASVGQDVALDTLCRDNMPAHSLAALPISRHCRDKLLTILEEAPASTEALCRLDTHDLVAVEPPRVTSIAVFDALLKQTMLIHERIDVLEQQDCLWSDDEIRYHVRHMLDQTDNLDIQFVDPVLATAMLLSQGRQLIDMWKSSIVGQVVHVVMIVWVRGHWIPLQLRAVGDVLYVSSWDSMALPRSVELFCEQFGLVLDCPRTAFRLEKRRFATGSMCGVCAVRFLDHIIRGKMLPTATDEVLHLHRVGRALFLDFLLDGKLPARPWLWGSGLDSTAHAKLVELLTQHGVPSSQTATRVHLIVQSLGTGPVQNAMLGSSPWRSLKSIANSCKPVVQLVLPDELQAQVSKKMQQGGVGSKVRKPRKQVAKAVDAAPLALDPLKLAVDQGIFESEHGVGLRQIGLSQICPFAEGIVVVSVAMAEAYLKADVAVNNLALGLLVVDAKEEDMPVTLGWEQVRVALRCAANGEPILAMAHLIQLGGVVVRQAKGKLVHEVAPADVACAKVSVYRDAISIPWEEFCKGPIKYVFGVLVPLQVCDSCSTMPDSSCELWHREDGSSVQEPVLDVWRRQWVSLQFRVTGSEEASIFIVNLRCLMKLEPLVLQCSGREGLYVEPRSVDGRSANLDYQVLWLAHCSHAEVERLRSCNPLSIGVARIGSRLGLRSKTMDAAKLGAAVKPGSIFLAAGERFDFEVGPLPFGLDRIALSKMFLAWGWQARPLHTSRTLPGLNGAVWLVQACVEPPQNVVTMKHGEVVISKLGSRTSTSSTGRGEVVGSEATLALCKTMAPGGENLSSSKAVDPWTIRDPWSQYNKSLSGTPHSTVAMKQVEDKVEQTVLAKLPDFQARDQDVVQLVQNSKQTDERVVALEAQMQQLTAQQFKVEQRVDETGRRQDAQICQFQHQISAQMEAQGGQIESLFRQQMASIETLLAKKSRSRSRHE